MRQPTHTEILEKLEELTELIRPLSAIQPELKAMADIYKAGKVGSGAVKWIASLGTAILAVWLFAQQLMAGIFPHNP